MKRYKNPLRKRVFREIKDEWPKYLVIFLLMTLMIGFVSGMYVANDSMLESAAEMKTQNRLEEGHFALKKKASSRTINAMERGGRASLFTYYRDKARKEADEEIEEKFEKEFTQKLKAQLKDVPAQYYDEYFREAYDRYHNSSLAEVREEAYAKIDKEVGKELKKVRHKYGLDKKGFKDRPVTIYENFYRDSIEKSGKRSGKVRVFKIRRDINKADILKGRLPVNDNEIAIDRMHAENIKVKVGDTINVAGKDMKVTGLIALPDYSSLFEDNTDVMFDAITFDVALVTDEAFDSMDGSVVYSYSYVYSEFAGDGKIVRPADDSEAKKWTDDLMTVVLTQAVTDGENEIKDFNPGYSNQAITFTENDMYSDKSMCGLVLYIFTVVFAFIFAVTIRNTIVKEATVIGTLRASGYSRGELIRHYMSMPVIVVIISAIVGNILGYTCMKQIVVDMYYASYSLPAYHTFFSWDAAVSTTIVPVIIMILVNLVVITVSMMRSPLAFIRGDLSSHRKKRAVKLRAFSFIGRFRLRIFFQNIPGYVVLFVGILFVTVLLSMGVGMQSTLDYYKANVDQMMIAKYQTMLTSSEDEDGNEIKTDTAYAEKFATQTLVRKSASHNEDVSVYGVVKDSRYVGFDDYDYNEKLPEVIVSQAYHDKYGVGAGDTLALSAQYTNETYRFRVRGIYQKNTMSIAVYMPLDQFRKIFDLGKDEFSGFFSNEKIKDIPSKYIAVTIGKNDILRMVNQLDVSMGNIMTYYTYLCIIVAAIIMYLMTKLIIEKNENAISMTKILGYKSKEIASIYLTPTTIIVIICDVIATFAGVYCMSLVWNGYMLTTSGWYAFHMKNSGIVEIFVFILISYCMVMALDFHRIKKIPMALALKTTA